METDFREWIAEYGLNGILDAMRTICYGKADHLRTNWQDDPSARAWEIQARAISASIAGDVSEMPDALQDELERMIDSSDLSSVCEALSTLYAQMRDTAKDQARTLTQDAKRIAKVRITL